MGKKQHIQQIISGTVMTVTKLMIQNEKKKALQESGLICKTLQRIHTLCTCSYKKMNVHLQVFNFYKSQI